MSRRDAEHSRRGDRGPRVLVADAEPAHVGWLERCLGDRYELEIVQSAREVRDALADDPLRLLIVGRQLADGSGAELLAELHQHGRSGDISLFVADEGDGAGAPPAQGTVFYVMQPGLPPEDVQALLARAAEKTAAEPPAAVRSTSEAARLQRVLELARRLAMQSELHAAAAVATEAAIELTDSDRAYCLFYDAESGALWTETGDAETERELSAVRGLAGFAARTGRPVAALRAARDPRYDAGIDDPGGRGDERIAVQPVLSAAGEVHAVLVVVRAARRPAWGAELGHLEELAGQWGPLLHQLALHVQAASVIEDSRREQYEEGLFRREAVEAYATRGHRGDVVRVSPAWVARTYWLLLAVLVVGGGYTVLGTISRYSSGPCVVLVSGRTDIYSRVAGEVAEVAAVPGAKVAAGDPLVTLQGRLDQAQQVVRAPNAGVVSDVLVHPGMQVAAGEVLLSLDRRHSQMYLVALLPGRDRPRLRPGMPLRLELPGYRGAYRQLTVDAVHDELLGPAAARRYLGPRLGDTLPVTGAVVVVEARLPQRTFEADGRTYAYHEGMSGRAEVRLGSRSILETLVPGLKGL